MTTLEAMRQLGLFSVMRQARRSSLTVLTVHGVAPVRRDLLWDPLRQQIDVSTFTDQIDTISRHHNWVDVTGAIAQLRGDVHIDNPVLLTFDDGYRNNLDLALPVLEARGIRPLLFVTTGYLNNARTFWFDRFDYAIQQIERQWKLKVEGRTFTFEPGDRCGMQNEYRSLRRHAKRQGWHDQHFHDFFSETCDALEAHSGKALNSFQSRDPVAATISSEDLRGAVARGVIDVGSHTIDHMRIDKLDRDARAYQLSQSKVDLEAMTGQPCRTFCYPNGDWDVLSREAVSDAGYEAAFSVEPGLNAIGCDLLTIRRMFLPLRFNAAHVEALGCGLLSYKQRLSALLEY
jgi:peptidoglycan/xylan/chitin deacetylase (PgdA/CDA1 family)